MAELYKACSHGNLAEAEQLAKKIGPDVAKVLYQRTRDCEPVLFRYSLFVLFVCLGLMSLLNI